jgi:hypothetical protein
LTWSFAMPFEFQFGSMTQQLFPTVMFSQRTTG